MKILVSRILKTLEWHFESHSRPISCRLRFHFFLSFFHFLLLTFFSFPSFTTAIEVSSFWMSRSVVIYFLMKTRREEETPSKASPYSQWKKNWEINTRYVICLVFYVRLLFFFSVSSHSIWQFGTRTIIMFVNDLFNQYANILLLCPGPSIARAVMSSLMRSNLGREGKQFRVIN